MAFHVIEEVPDVRLAHFMGSDSSTVGLSTTVTSKYLTYPIGIRRPAEGRAQRGVYCGTCKQSVQVIVPSAGLTLRTQRYWLAPAMAFLAVFVAEIVYLGTRDHWRLSFGFFALLFLSLFFIGLPVVVMSLERSNFAHGVKVARRQPSKVRRYHSIREAETRTRTRAGRRAAAAARTAQRPSS